jgi:hypothetical protein
MWVWPAFWLCWLGVASACAAQPTPTPVPTFTSLAVIADSATTNPTLRYAVDVKLSIFRYQASGQGIFGATKLPGTFGVESGEVLLVPNGGGLLRLRADLFIDGRTTTAVNDLILGVMRSALEVEKYPTSALNVASKAAFDSAPLHAGKPLVVPISGTLQIRDVTRTLELPLILRLSGELLTGQGTLTLDLSDYGISVPTAIIDSKLILSAEINARLSGPLTR